MPARESALDYRWVPGEGCDAQALENMRGHFLRPAEPIGEAWFMGEEREVFPALMGDLTALKVDEVFRPLEEIASGTMSFGPAKEWRDWYHFLLPHLIPRANDSYVYSVAEMLVTAFIAQHPNGVFDQHYKGFRADVLKTLGRTLMEPACWNGEALDVKKGLGKFYRRGVQDWGSYEAGGKFSSLLFLCAKYLRPSESPSWIESVLDIRDPHWRAQTMVWLVGVNPLISGSITQINELDDLRPELGWNWSHALSGQQGRSFDGAAPLMPFFDATQRETLSRSIRQYFSDHDFFEWSADFSRDQTLVSEIGDLPDRFRDLYVAS